MKKILFLFILIFLTSCNLIDLSVETDKYFVETNSRICIDLEFNCNTNEKKFFSDKGCGCQDLETHYCNDDDREIPKCLGDYDYVCGYFNKNTVFCESYPCGEIFENGCEACINPDIISWVEGNCRFS